MFDSCIHPFCWKKSCFLHILQRWLRIQLGELLWSCGYYCTWWLNAAVIYLLIYLMLKYPISCQCSCVCLFTLDIFGQLSSACTTGCSKGQRKILNDIIGKQSTTFRTEKLFRTNYLVSSNKLQEGKEGGRKAIDGKRLEKPDKCNFWLCLHPN